jgi:hypothetical protein
MFKKISLKLLVFLLAILVTGCFSYIARYDGTYKGKVIDADTGEPVEGVVVLGTWYSIIIGDLIRFDDARETVTDKNGEFSIPGKGLRIMSNLEPMRVMIFKAGYGYEEWSWKSFKEVSYYKDKFKLEESYPVIGLKKLTMKERKKRGSPVRPNIPIEKMKLMTKEISKERIERGLDPL